MKHAEKLWMIGWAMLGAAALAATEKPLRIYLPQEVRLDSASVDLGRVGILLGDPSLIEKAQSVQLGTFAVEGQTLWVDRNTILSRLASGGIRAHQVQLLGAEKVRIGRYEMTLSADRIVACAQRYLEGKLTDVKGAAVIVLRPPQPRILSSEAGAAELSVYHDEQQGGGVRKISVAILQDGKEIGREEVYFTVRYQSRRVIAARELLPGTTLTSEDIRIETVQTDQREPDGWVVPYGMVTRQRIAEGATVSEGVLEPKQEPILVRRRQNVVVRIDTGALLISAYGEAMDEGRVGEIIRVRRGDRPQERIIVCRIQTDGSVEPVL
jgi:flagella basal body P-ring formation protein FlgA